MMMLLHSLATEALAVAVAGAALCRLAPMHLPPHPDPVTGLRVRYRADWVLVYLSMFLGATAALLDVWDGRPSWAVTVLLASMAGYLWQSRVTWRGGPPRFMRIEDEAGKPREPAAWPWPGEPRDR